MIANNLLITYERMRLIGLVGNKREFSRIWCGKGQDYLRDYVGDDRLDAAVPVAVITRLKDKLLRVAALVPRTASRELRAIVDAIETAERITALLRR